MVETRAKWTDLIQGVGLTFAEVFNQALEEYTPGIFNILNNVQGDGAQRNVTGKTGAGKIAKFTDADNLPELARYKTYTTQIAYVNYGGYIDVSKNTIEDRNFSAELDEMRDLSISANYAQDESGVQLLNGGFATTVSVNGYDMTWYGDGKPLFSTIHPTVVTGGSTQSNASANSIPFDSDNLEVGLVALVEQKSDDGMAMVAMGKPMLVLPPALRKEGLRVTESELDPDTAENAINVYRNGMAVDMANSTFLAATNGGSDTAWYVVIPGRHKLNHETRQAPQMDQDTNIKNKVVTFTVDARWVESVTDWRRTWASKGDSSTYSS